MYYIREVKPAHHTPSSYKSKEHSLASIYRILCISKNLKASDIGQLNKRGLILVTFLANTVVFLTVPYIFTGTHQVVFLKCLQLEERNTMTNFIKHLPVAATMDHV